MAASLHSVYHDTHIQRGTRRLREVRRETEREVETWTKTGTYTERGTNTDAEGRRGGDLEDKWNAHAAAITAGLHDT